MFSVVSTAITRRKNVKKMLLFMACLAFVLGICGCSNQEDVVADETTTETVSTQPIIEETVMEPLVEEIEAVDAVIAQDSAEDDIVVVEQELPMKELMLGDFIAVTAPEHWNESADGNTIVFEDGDGRALQFDIDDDANTLEYTVIVGMLEASETMNYEIIAEPRTIAGYEAVYFMGTTVDTDNCVAICMCVSLIEGNLLIVSYNNAAGSFLDSELEFFDGILDGVWMKGVH